MEAIAMKTPSRLSQVAVARIFVAMIASLCFFASDARASAPEGGKENRPKKERTAKPDRNDKPEKNDRNDKADRKKSERKSDTASKKKTGRNSARKREGAKPDRAPKPTPSATPAPVEEKKDDKGKVDPRKPAANVRELPLMVTGRVIHGQAAHARFAQKVGVVDVDRSFSVIEEYQNIKREGLDERRARYHFYLRKANQRFATAVQTVARAQGIQVVTEAGGVTGGKRDQIVDLTDEVIRALER